MISVGGERACIWKLSLFFPVFLLGGTVCILMSGCWFALESGSGRAIESHSFLQSPGLLHDSSLYEMREITPYNEV